MFANVKNMFSLKVGEIQNVSLTLKLSIQKKQARAIVINTNRIVNTLKQKLPEY